MYRFILHTVLISAMMLFSSAIYANEPDEKLTVFTSVFLKDSNIDSVRIRVLEEEIVKQDFLAEKAERIELNLDYNKKYDLYFEKSGFVSKIIQINTFIPDNQTTNQEILDFEVELFSFYDEVDLSVFEEPVAIIAYDSIINGFNYNLEYAFEIANRINKARKDLNKRERYWIKKEKDRKKKLAKLSSKEKREIDGEVQVKNLAKNEKNRKEEFELLSNTVETSLNLILSKKAVEFEKVREKEHKKELIRQEEAIKETRKVFHETEVKRIEKIEKEKELKKNLLAEKKESSKIRLLFDFNQYKLNESYKQQLKEIADKLKKNKTQSLEITGHTCNVGSEEVNRIFAEARAKYVYDFLINQGIEKTRLTYSGKGLHEPSASNNTETGRAQNRRVELNFIDDSEPLYAKK